ncbi:DUF2804 domain-containing protein [Streptosporangium sp. NBC_01756]|uniref:DUF2804 domain-containing protein n=1 Tax=Streptosporangium sp. NBC_01756 TaxID=2975950 RepID=UPI002DD79FF2|nr:DUF2804 domain-containing protein [Streptosporangium sp. NBC_01756]WSC84689.1 DUF2804 domain-containing protein [Streptosporangium sp. NBC_01756]
MSTHEASTHEREITAPTDLCTPDGRLNPAAVGWSRTPLHRCNLRGWGRTKRWEYWCVTTPTHLIAITVSDIDYLGLNSVYFLEYGGRELARTSMIPLARGVRLPQSLGDGDVTVRGAVTVGIRQEESGTRLTARCATPDGPLEADLLVALPPGHETLSVVVPWSGRRFQYTSKHTARPAEGTVRIGSTAIDFTGGWGVLDHGRGRWPYDTLWNWGAASGHTGGHTVGLQLGGKWTVGTGMTENALCVDGRLTKIGEELDWGYSDFLGPWTVRTPGSDRVELTFTPFHERADRTDTGLILNDTHQCFGHYSGVIRPVGGSPIEVDGLLGWAEQVHMRW